MVRAADFSTSLLVSTVTLMGTSCNSFSTLVALTCTSPALSGSSAWAGKNAAMPRAVRGRAHNILLTSISPPKRV